MPKVEKENISGVSFKVENVSGVTAAAPSIVKEVEKEVVAVEKEVVKVVKEGYEGAKELLEGRKAELVASLPLQPTEAHKSLVQKIIGEFEVLLHKIHL